MYRKIFRTLDKLFPINSDAELARARAILKIATEIYAFAGSQGQVFPDDAGMWTADGENYSLTFNASNDNFFIEGKNGNPLVVLGVDGELDTDVIYSVTEKDEAYFKSLQNALATYCFPRNESPAQTQAKARTRWAREGS